MSSVGSAINTSMYCVHQRLPKGRLEKSLIAAVLVVWMFSLITGCDDSSTPLTDADRLRDAEASADADADADADGDIDGDGDVDSDVDSDADDYPPGIEVPPPPDMTPSVESMARGFRLYYRERVERAIVAYNRFALFGDSTFASSIGHVAVARNGNDFEVIPGPTDNNRIGTGTWMAYNAYRVFRSRALELTLIRQFDGLVFFETVSGHAGLTAREVYPGWTRVMNGFTDTVTRTRFGIPAFAPQPGEAAIEAEVLSRFFDDVVVTYRENPEEFLFNYRPGADVSDYAVTNSFSELPRFLRVSDCCSSLMRTPEPHAWAGAFWGNHNSRDNFPDLALGFIAAMAVAEDPESSDDVRSAARRAIEAGHRIGDLIIANDYSLMTVDEHHDYDTLVISGTVRPDGEVESQDLGSFGVCTAAYLARAISTGGLTTPEPALPLPGSLDQTLFAELDFVFDCEIPEEGVTCRSISDAWCGFNWLNFYNLRLFDEPVLEFLHANPDMGPLILESFQDDFDEMTVGALGLAHYARLRGDDVLYERARGTVYAMTWLMQEFADLAFPDNPDRRAEQRYRAALYQAQAELPALDGDLGDFELADAQIGYLEALLSLGNTGPAALLSDDEIRSRIETELSNASDSVVERYHAEYGDTPPVRRAGEGYEARGTPLSDYPWRAVERPHHASVGGIHLVHAIPLCEHAPQLVDCSWARLGCERPDLNGSRRVDDTDRGIFEAALGGHVGVECNDGNRWCDGADLDRSAAADSDDIAFMDAAQGCFY